MSGTATTLFSIGPECQIFSHRMSVYYYHMRISSAWQSNESFPEGPKVAKNMNGKTGDGRARIIIDSTFVYDHVQDHDGGEWLIMPQKGD